jgi:REP element-mobilizing transposase RayT
MEDQSQLYHVYTKSISDFHIYRRHEDFQRMIEIVRYYQYANLPMSFSDFRRLPFVLKDGFDKALNELSMSRNWQKRVDVIVYCVMNTHIHLIICEQETGTMSAYMSDILNSYTRFFNNQYNRRGPLWQSRFGRNSIASQESLLKVAAYVHMNPVKAGIVSLPAAWKYSSYMELFNEDGAVSFCMLKNYLQNGLDEYKKYILAELATRTS